MSHNHEHSVDPLIEAIDNGLHIVLIDGQYHIHLAKETGVTYLSVAQRTALRAARVAYNAALKAYMLAREVRANAIAALDTEARRLAFKRATAIMALESLLVDPATKAILATVVAEIDAIPDKPVPPALPDIIG